MDILPAIDLRGGKVVRLRQGDYDDQTVYRDDPVAVAREFVSAGARWIHMVDLDAARTGRRTQTGRIAEVCAAVADDGASVQCGGGVRDRRAIDALLAAGARRLVIGSAALKDPGWFDALLADETVPNERIALGLDARGGRLAAEGWTRETPERPADWARRVAGSGLGAIVYTDIARDGMLAGPNVEATADLVAATDVPVIASGGVRSVDDVRRCKAAGCAGAIIGRAWYEGAIDLAQAIAAAQEN